MSAKKPHKVRPKYKTKLYKADYLNSELESFRQLLADEDDMSQLLSPAEMRTYKERARVVAARLVEKGASRASGTRAHS